MKEPSDFCKVRVTFGDGTFIEARYLEIDFDTREMSLRRIGKHSVSFADSEVIKESDGICFLIELDPPLLQCDAGEIKLPFKKCRGENDE